MATTLFTILLFALALVGLGIGYLLTGKSKLRACGQNPTKQRDAKTCGKSIRCPVCDETSK